MLPELAKLDVPEMLDHRTAPELVLRAYAALDADPRGLVLDFARTTVVDEVGLQALASLHGYAGDGAVLLENVCGTVAARFRAEGLDERCFVRRLCAERAVGAAPGAESSGSGAAPTPPCRASGSHLRLVRDE